MSNLRTGGGQSYIGYDPVLGVSACPSVTNGSLTTTFGKTSQLDSNGRLRISTANTLVDSQQEYGLNTITKWDATANGVMAAMASNASVSSAGNAVGPRNANTRLTPVTVSTTSGHYAVLQSRQYTRYVPGKIHNVVMTGVFSPGTVANTDARSGYFDANNGVFLKITNGQASLVQRSSTSGAVVDTAVNQANWNQDPLDGTGQSGKTIDFSKMQLMLISGQWLGVGEVSISFYLNGKFEIAHIFDNSNIFVTPYTQSFNLPVRMELRNTGASTGGTIQFGCFSVQSENGEEPVGFPWAASTGTAVTAVTTRRPVLSIRPKATFNSLTNRAHIQDFIAIARATTNDSFAEMVYGGTLTGAAFTSVSADSVVEFDTTATAITGGQTMISGYAISGQGSTGSVTFSNADLGQYPLVLSQIDALAANQIPISLVFTSMSGTSNIAASLNWHERKT